MEVKETFHSPDAIVDPFLVRSHESGHKDSKEQPFRSFRERFNFKNVPSQTQKPNDYNSVTLKRTSNNVPSIIELQGRSMENPYDTLDNYVDNEQNVAKSGGGSDAQWIEDSYYPMEGHEESTAKEAPLSSASPYEAITDAYQDIEKENSLSNYITDELGMYLI